MKNRAFTLIELLVVVLIIGILVAIAVPQYQKAVLKADLHKGIPLVASICQAQQAYYLAHGDFATTFEELDLTLPLNESCVKNETTTYYNYKCDFGRIGLYNDFSNVQFITSNSQLAYLHQLRELEISAYNMTFEAGKRYCFAKYGNETAKSVCQSMGGAYMGEASGYWVYYSLD